MENKILFIGFELGSNRKEAVSINFKNHVNRVMSKGLQYRIYSLRSDKSLISHLLNIFRYLGDIYKIIKREKVTQVHDFFVLPVISLLFGVLIKLRFPKLILIKEIHNNFGFSKVVSMESVLRLFLSSKLSMRLLAFVFNIVYSRSKYVSNLWKVKYIPQYIPIYKLSRRETYDENIVRVCYLGHPLAKKGIGLFPEIIRHLDDNLKNKIVFNFAFSNIGNKFQIISEIKNEARTNNIRVRFQNTIEAFKFFRQNDIFILPLVDEHSATSVPNTVLEAMEAGCVVLANDNAIIRSVIKNGNNGILNTKLNAVDAINHLNSFTLSKTLVAKLSSNSRKYIELNHNLRYIRECFKEIYENK